MHTEDRLLTITKAAEILHMSEDWVYRRWKKEFPFAFKLGKEIRFSLKGLLAFIAASQRQREEEVYGRQGIQARRDVPHSV